MSLLLHFCLKLHRILQRSKLRFAVSRYLANLLRNPVRFLPGVLPILGSACPVRVGQKPDKCGHFSSLAGHLLLM